MASTISNVFHCPTSRFSPNKNSFLKPSNFRPSIVRFSRHLSLNQKAICAASSAAGSSSPDNDLNPYEVLGVNPIEGFDMVKAAYTRKRKDAERRGDEVTADRLEKAYDKLMMAQLMNRKKGVTFGSFKDHVTTRFFGLILNGEALKWGGGGFTESFLYNPNPLTSNKRVSKDIKYADKQPLLPWGPRFSKSDVKDMKINMAITAAFTAWILIKRYAEWKPLQFLSFVFVYRIFEKLKASEPPVSPTFAEEEVQDEGRMLRMGKRILRSLALVFGCIAVSSLGYTGVLNLIEFTGGYIPAFLYNNQELVITASSAIMLYVMATYYR